MQCLHHGGDERLIGELDGAAESVAEEFPAEGPQEFLLAGGGEVVAQAAGAIDGGAIGQGDGGDDRAATGIDVPEAADGVEVFEGEPVGIDAGVAA